MLYPREFSIEIKKLFTNNPKFDYFRCVNEEKVNKNIEMFRSTHSINNYQTLKNPKLGFYHDVILAALNNIRLTFDEKMLFVIKLCDPSFDTYYTALEFNILTKKELDALPEEDQEDAIYDNEIVKLERKNAIRSKIGFYQPDLIFYEKVLILIQNKKEKNVSLSTGIKQDHTRKLIEKLESGSVNLSISDEELDNIINEANEYIKQYGKPAINDLAYQLTLESDNFNVKGLRDKLLFILYVIDSNFEYYKSYENHGTWKEIATDITSLLGEYNQLVMDIEIKYNEQVKKLSTW